jgi:hypothetical protein
MLVEEKLACVKSDLGKVQCARVAFKKSALENLAASALQPNSAAL